MTLSNNSWQERAWVHRWRDIAAPCTQEPDDDDDDDDDDEIQ
jgi:hypothetical protein